MRISREQMWMSMAEVAARRSTCYRRSVGAVIVYGTRILSVGYNGPGRGEPHCTGPGCGDNGCSRAIHAEKNAILKLLPEEFRLPNKVLFVTESPCPSCAKDIVQANIAAVAFMHRYRIGEGIEELLRSGVQVFRMTASGYIICERTGQLINET